MSFIAPGTILDFEKYQGEIYRTLASTWIVQLQLGDTINLIVNTGQLSSVYSFTGQLLLESK